MTRSSATQVHGEDGRREASSSGRSRDCLSDIIMPPRYCCRHSMAFERYVGAKSSAERTGQSLSALLADRAGLLPERSRLGGIEEATCGGAALGGLARVLFRVPAVRAARGHLGGEALQVLRVCSQQREGRTDRDGGRELASVGVAAWEGLREGSRQGVERREAGQSGVAAAHRKAPRARRWRPAR